MRECFRGLIMKKTTIDRNYNICKNCRELHLNKHGYVCNGESHLSVNQEEFNETKAPVGCSMLLELVVLNK
jgi:hypothetical protein